MKPKIVIKAVLIFYIFSTVIFAQTSIFSAESKDNDIVFRVKINSQIRDGFSIRLAEGEAVVPVNVLLDGKSLWLKNSSQKPDKGEAISWQQQDNELYFQLYSQSISDNAEIVINCKLHSSKKRAVSGQISLHSLLIENGKFKTAAEAIAVFQLPGSGQ